MTTRPNQVKVGSRTITKTCTVPGCTRPHAAKGLCMTHYRRLQRKGTLDLTYQRNKGTTCEVDGCERPATVKGMCRMHHDRREIHGTPGPAGRLVGGALAERIWRKVIKRGPQECWGWDGPVSGRTQFPVLAYAGTTVSVRRVLYREVRGEQLADNEVVRTTCTTPSCVNPAHFQVSRR